MTDRTKTPVRVVHSGPQIDLDEAKWAALRAPFPPEQIGKLPRVWCSDCSKAPGRGKAKHCSKHQGMDCTVCRNSITSAHLHLDYVGHAAVTSRLLAVDPAWSWRPATKEELETLPPFDRNREMWIVLTVLGKSVFGIGDDMGRDGTDGTKIMIGDAIRNAALRLGVAIDLWSKEDLIGKAEAAAEVDDELRRESGGNSEAEAATQEEWLRKAKDAKTLDELTKLAHEANDKGLFKGAIKAAMAGRRRQLEAAAKRETESKNPDKAPSSDHQS